MCSHISHSQKVDFADSGVDTTWGSIQTGQELQNTFLARIPIEESG